MVGIDQPGTTIVSARASAPSPCGVSITNPVCVRTAAVAGRDDEELVPGLDDVAAVEPEDLAGDCEVEGERALVDDRGDGAHGPNLAKVVPGTPPPAEAPCMR